MQRIEGTACMVPFALVVTHVVQLLSIALTAPTVRAIFLLA